VATLTYYVAVDRLNVRKGPSTKDAIVGKLSKGDKVSIVAPDPAEQGPMTYSSQDWGGKVAGSSVWGVVSQSSPPRFVAVRYNGKNYLTKSKPALTPSTKAPTAVATPTSEPAEGGGLGLLAAAAIAAYALLG
jgi:hypothetical protein